MASLKNGEMFHSNTLGKNKKCALMSGKRCVNLKWSTWKHVALLHTASTSEQWLYSQVSISCSTVVTASIVWIDVDYVKKYQIMSNVGHHLSALLPDHSETHSLIALAYRFQRNRSITAMPLLNSGEFSYEKRASLTVARYEVTINMDLPGNYEVSDMSKYFKQVFISRIALHQI